MLTEFQRVKQEPGGRRRWFEGEGLELIVWYDGASERLAGFQLCYGSPEGERALTWTAAAGFVHSRVDAGDSSPLKNETPVLLPGGAVPWAQVEALFRARGAALDPALRDQISARLAARG